MRHLTISTRNLVAMVGKTVFGGMLLICSSLVTSCKHTQKGSSAAQRIFTIEDHEKTWPKGYYVEGVFKNGKPKVKYFKIPAHHKGKRLFDSCGYWELEGEEKWINQNNTP